MSFFERVSGGNPLSTQVGQLIEQATDGSLASENWAVNMEICDLINETDEGPKDAIKALKKKLSSNVGKNYQVIMYSLTVLETAVKNCGRRFHVQVASKDFLSELIKIIGPKNDPPQAVQENILSLIQTWADAFKGIPELKEVEKQYYDLKKKGIEFPMADLDKMAPIHTPARTGPGSDHVMTYPPQQLSPRAELYRVPDDYEQQQIQQQQQMQQQQQQQQMMGGMPPVPVAEGPINLNPEQLTKLNSELEVVGQNCKVFNEMLTEMSPGQEDPSDLELLQELNRTCRQMQQRIVELLDKVATEEVTNELLRVNDDLNNAFLRYERFERYRTGQSTQNQTPVSNSDTLPLRTAALPGPPDTGSGEPATTPNLIDLGDTFAPSNQNAPVNTNDISVQLASMNVGDVTASQQLGQINSMPAAANAAANQPAPDEFDMFAQSRQSFDTPKANPAEVYNAQEQAQVQASLGAITQQKNEPFQGVNLLGFDDEEVSDKPVDLAEMEKWLSSNEAATGAGAESATSAEFDKFLAERAKEGETLPDLPTTNSNTNPRRQMQKDDAENALFAL